VPAEELIVWLEERPLSRQPQLRVV
jgi:hypothetical protein